MAEIKRWKLGVDIDTILHADEAKKELNELEKDRKVKITAELTADKAKKELTDIRKEIKKVGEELEKAYSANDSSAIEDLEDELKVLKRRKDYLNQFVKDQKQATQQQIESAKTLETIEESKQKIAKDTAKVQEKTNKAAVDGIKDQEKAIEDVTKAQDKASKAAVAGKKKEIAAVKELIKDTRESVTLHVDDRTDLKGILDDAKKVEEALSQIEEHCRAAVDEVASMDAMKNSLYGRDLKGKRQFQNAIKEAWNTGEKNKAAKLFEQYKIKFPDGKFNPDQSFGSDWTNNFESRLDSVDKFLAGFRERRLELADELELWNQSSSLRSAKKDLEYQHRRYYILNGEAKNQEEAEQKRQEYLNSPSDVLAETKKLAQIRKEIADLHSENMAKRAQLRDAAGLAQFDAEEIREMAKSNSEVSQLYKDYLDNTQKIADKNREKNAILNTLSKHEIFDEQDALNKEYNSIGKELDQLESKYYGIISAVRQWIQLQQNMEPMFEGADAAEIRKNVIKALQGVSPEIASLIGESFQNGLANGFKGIKTKEIHSMLNRVINSNIMGGVSDGLNMFESLDLNDFDLDYFTEEYKTGFEPFNQIVDVLGQIQDKREQQLAITREEADLQWRLFNVMGKETETRNAQLTDEDLKKIEAENKARAERVALMQKEREEANKFKVADTEEGMLEQLRELDKARDWSDESISFIDTKEYSQYAQILDALIVKCDNVGDAFRMLGRIVMENPSNGLREWSVNDAMSKLIYDDLLSNKELLPDDIGYIDDHIEMMEFYSERKPESSVCQYIARLIIGDSEIIQQKERELENQLKELEEIVDNYEQMLDQRESYLYSTGLNPTSVRWELEDDNVYAGIKSWRDTALSATEAVKDQLKLINHPTVELEPVVTDDFSKKFEASIVEKLVPIYISPEQVFDVNAPSNLTNEKLYSTKEIEQNYENARLKVQQIGDELEEANTELEKMQQNAELFGYTADMSARQAGKVRKTLEKDNRAQYVVHMLKQGYSPIDTGDGEYGFDRPDLGKGVWTKTTKTEYEYAKYLQGAVSELNVGWEEGLQILAAQNGQLEAAKNKVEQLRSKYDIAQSESNKAYERMAYAHSGIFGDEAIEETKRKLNEETEQRTQEAIESTTKSIERQGQVYKTTLNLKNQTFGNNELVKKSIIDETTASIYKQVDALRKLQKMIITESDAYREQKKVIGELKDKKDSAGRSYNNFEVFGHDQVYDIKAIEKIDGNIQQIDSKLRKGSLTVGTRDKMFETLALYDRLMSGSIYNTIDKTFDDVDGREAYLEAFKKRYPDFVNLHDLNYTKKITPGSDDSFRFKEDAIELTIRTILGNIASLRAEAENGTVKIIDYFGELREYVGNIDEAITSAESHAQNHLERVAGMNQIFNSITGKEPVLNVSDRVYQYLADAGVISGKDDKILSPTIPMAFNRGVASDDLYHGRPLISARDVKIEQMVAERNKLLEQQPVESTDTVEENTAAVKELTRQEKIRAEAERIKSSGELDDYDLSNYNKARGELNKLAREMSDLVSQRDYNTTTLAEWEAVEQKAVQSTAKFLALYDTVDDKFGGNLGDTEGKGAALFVRNMYGDAISENHHYNKSHLRTLEVAAQTQDKLNNKVEEYVRLRESAAGQIKNESEIHQRLIDDIQAETKLSKEVISKILTDANSKGLDATEIRTALESAHSTRLDEDKNRTSLYLDRHTTRPSYYSVAYPEYIINDDRGNEIFDQVAHSILTADEAISIFKKEFGENIVPVDPEALAAAQERAKIEDKIGQEVEETVTTRQKELAIEEKITEEKKEQNRETQSGTDLLNGIMASTEDAHKKAKETADSFAEARKGKGKGSTYSRNVYHGSEVPLDNATYDPSKGAGVKKLGIGLYTTPDLELAAQYGQNIAQKTVALKNAFILTEDYITNISDLYAAMGSKAPENATWESVTTALHSFLSTQANAADFTRRMQEMGYDGLYSKGFGFTDDDGFTDKNAEQLVIYDEQHWKDLTTTPYSELVTQAQKHAQIENQIGHEVEETVADKQRELDIEQKITSEKQKQAQDESDDSQPVPVDILEKDDARALNQFRKAQDNQTPLIDLSNVHSQEDLEDQLRNMAINSIADENLSGYTLDEVRVEDSVGIIKLYNKELETAITRTYKLTAASKEADAELEFVKQSIKHNVKALRENQIDKDFEQEFAKAKIENLLQPLNGAKYDGEQKLRDLANGIVDKSSLEAFNKQMQIAKTEVSTFKKQLASDLDTMTKMSNTMLKATGTTKAYRQEYEKLKDTAGSGVLGTSLDTMESAIGKYNATDDLQEQIKAFKEYDQAKKLYDSNVKAVRNTHTDDVNAEKARTKALEAEKKQYKDVIKLQEKLYSEKKKLETLKITKGVDNSETIATQRITNELEEQYNTSMGLLNNEQKRVLVANRELQLEKELSRVINEQNRKVDDKAQAQIDKTWKTRFQDEYKYNNGKTIADQDALDRMAQDYKDEAKTAEINVRNIEALNNLEAKMRNVEIHIENMKTGLNQLGNVNGIGKATEAIERMVDATKEFREAATLDDKTAAYDKYITAEQDYKDFSKYAQIESKEMVRFAELEGKMANVNTELDTMAIRMDKIGDVPGAEKAVDTLYKMEEAAAAFNAAQTLGEKETAYNNYQSYSQQFKAEMDNLSAAQQQQRTTQKQSENDIKSYYRTLSSTIQQISSLDSKMNTLKTKDGGTGKFLPLIQDLEAQKNTLLGQVGDISKQMRDALQGGFEQGYKVDLPFSSILNNIPDDADAADIERFFNDARVQAALTEKDINSLVFSLQKSQNGLEEFGLGLVNKTEEVQKAFNTFTGLNKLNTADVNSDLYKRASASMEAFFTYKNGEKDAKLDPSKWQGLDKDVTKWTAEQVLMFQKLANEAIEYTNVLNNAMQKEAQYFVNKRKYSDLGGGGPSNIDNYNLPSTDVKSTAEDIKDARGELTKAAQEFANGEAVITGFRQSADGISTLDFSVFDKGTNSLRQFSMEMGTASKQMYVTESTIDKTVKRTQTAYQQLGKMSGLIKSLELSGFDVVPETAHSSVQRLYTLMQALDIEMKDGNPDEIERLTREAKLATAEVEKLYNSSIKMQHAVQDGTAKNIGNYADNSKYTDYEQLTDAVHNYTATQKGATLEVGKFNEKQGELNYTMTDGAGNVSHYTASINKLGKSIDVQHQGVTKLKTGWQHFREVVSHSAKQMMMAFAGYNIFTQGIQWIRQGVTYIKEIDLAMTELKKVTDETAVAYDRFLDSAAQTGSKIGATVSDFVNATADFARIGYTMTEASEMAQAAIVYKNVADGLDTVEAATESITSTMKAFGIESYDTMTIIDAFNEVGNNFAITSAGIGEALKRSASALDAGGNTMEESIGLITGANTVVQDPEVVGELLPSSIVICCK